MHQNFLNFVHPDDVAGFEKSLKRAAKAVRCENGHDFAGSYPFSVVCCTCKVVLVRATHSGSVFIEGIIILVHSNYQSLRYHVELGRSCG